MNKTKPIRTLTHSIGRTSAPVGSFCIFLLALLLSGCEMGPRMFLSARDREIKSGTETIEAGGSNAGRAAAYIKRGHAYSEKARYSRAFKRISLEEYGRLFAAAIADHDQAVALDPNSAEAYYMRGHAYYDRADRELFDNADAKPWFDLAAADFKRAIEKDSKHYLAWDRLGMVHMSTGQYDQAIPVFEKEMALDSMGKARLADAYCVRGTASHREQKYEAAIADFEKSIAIGANPDSCSCNPRLPLKTLKEERKAGG